VRSGGGSGEDTSVVALSDNERSVSDDLDPLRFSGAGDGDDDGDDDGDILDICTRTVDAVGKLTELWRTRLIAAGLALFSRWPALQYG
jgi:hypothetical protein